MPAAKYVVDLSPEERQELLEFVRHGKKSARQITRARILLKADESLGDEEIADTLHAGIAAVWRACFDSIPRHCAKNCSRYTVSVPKPPTRSFSTQRASRSS